VLMKRLPKDVHLYTTCLKLSLPVNDIRKLSCLASLGSVQDLHNRSNVSEILFNAKQPPNSFLTGNYGEDEQTKERYLGKAFYTGLKSKASRPTPPSTTRLGLVRLDSTSV